jgi:radical SAM superfamily enzyme YgiQ (UPF0313 family)
MKIGLFDIDSKYHNLALMKLSTYHKQKGDEVEFYNPLWINTYGKIYVSKIFKKPNKNDGYIRRDMYCGGSGFNSNILPEKIEHIMPDYSLYNLNYSLGFTTRGCIRNCKFCIVPEKEGNIREHAEVEEFLNPKSNVVVLLDNNFLALPSHIKKLQKYIKKGWRMDFNQGLDIRLINKENAGLLTKVKLERMIRFAWDNIKDESKIIKGLELVIKAGIRPRNITVYILIGFDTTFEEDLYRIQRLRDIKDEQGPVKAYVMNYNNELKSRKYKDFMRWVNNPWVYKSCEWKEYKKC